MISRQYGMWRTPGMLDRRTLLRAGAGSLALALLLFGRAGHALAQDATTVSVGLNADVETMDPHGSTSIQCFTVWHHIFDGLTAQTAESELVPALAESWEVVSPVHWRFKLRPGVTFHDGQPLTSADVKFSLERLVDPQVRSPQAFLWGTLDRVDTPDELTADVMFKEPNAALLRNLSITAIIPASAAGNGGFFDLPVGTGPFKLDNWNRGAGLAVSAYADYWGEKPAAGGVDFRILPAASTRRAAIQAGEVDITTSLPPEQIAMLQGQGDIQVLTRALNQSQVIQFNCAKAPFSDPRVRQALNYGTDKEGLLRAIELGYGEPMTAPMPPAIPGYAADLDPYPYDPDRAKALLAEAGVTNLEMEISGFRGFFATGPTQQQAIAEQWSQFGIEATVDNLEFGSMIEKRTAGNYDCIYTVWSVLTADPDFALARNFLKGNAFEYENDQVDALLRQGLGEMSPERREEIYAEAQKLIWADCPWVWLWYPQSVVMARSRVQDYVVRADGLISARSLTLAA